MMATTSESISAEAALAGLAKALREVKLDNTLPDSLTDSIYAMAYQMLSKQDFEGARRCFSVLVDYQPSRSKNWAGLGHSLLGLNQAEGAFCAMSVAFSLEPDNAGVVMALGQAFAAAGYRGFASKAFEAAALIAGHDQPDIVARAKASLELLAGGSSAG